MNTKKFAELCAKHDINTDSIDISLEDDRDNFIESYLNNEFSNYVDQYIESVIEEFPYCIDCTGVFEVNNEEILNLLNEHKIEFSIYHENMDNKTIEITDYKFNNQYLNDCTIEHDNSCWSDKYDINYSVNGLKEIEIMLDEYMPIIDDFQIDTNLLDIHITNNYGNSYGYYYIGEDYFDCHMTVDILKEFLDRNFPLENE